jgi:CheY-like chemotaxis protein
LDVSKIEAGKMRLEYNAFSLKEVMLDVKELHLGAAENKELILNLEFHPDLHEIWIGDASRLNQIISNLVGNAIKFTEQGEINIIAKPGSPGLILSVSDTGVGITSEVQDLIFQPFSQADLSTSRKFGGTGLGLSICSKIAKLMGGDITLESSLGVGSTFFLNLPLVPIQGEELQRFNDKKNTVSNQVDQNLDHLKELRVLVAEDNKVNQMLIKKLLKKFDCHFVIAQDGEEAVSKFSEEKFDIILMDIRMPNMDGMEAPEKIRIIDQDIPIIALTADVAEGNAEKFLKLGMNEVVFKPFDSKQINNLLLKYSTPRS